MEIENHRLTANLADHVLTPNRGGQIDPKFIVMHYTAGYNMKSAVDWLCNPKAKASAHVVIGRNGDITQLAPFNIKTWHAGPSSFRGYDGLNSHSIGIEIVNIGYLRMFENGYIDGFGNKVSHAEVGGTTIIPYPKVGSGNLCWQLYTESQLKAVEELTKSLIEEYNIIDIVSHEEIDTRGWKTDPGPAFPMSRFKKLLTKTKNNRENDFEEYSVTANTLNMRGGPGTNFEIVGKLKKFDAVKVVRFSGDWALLDNSYWVHGAYLRIQ